MEQAPSHDGAPCFTAYTVDAENMGRPLFAIRVYDTTPEAGGADRTRDLALKIHRGTEHERVERQPAVDRDRIEVVGLPMAPDTPDERRIEACKAHHMAEVAARTSRAAAAAAAAVVSSTRGSGSGSGGHNDGSSGSSGSGRDSDNKSDQRVVLAAAADSFYIPATHDLRGWWRAILIIDRLEDGWEGVALDRPSPELGYFSTDRQYFRAGRKTDPHGGFLLVKWDLTDLAWRLYEEEKLEDEEAEAPLELWDVSSPIPCLAGQLATVRDHMSAVRCYVLDGGLKQELLGGGRGGG